MNSRIFSDSSVMLLKLYPRLCVSYRNRGIETTGMSEDDVGIWGLSPIL